MLPVIACTAAAIRLYCSPWLARPGAQLAVAILIAFVVGYAAVSWFLKFLVRHSMYWFVGYRVVLGVTVLALLGTGVVAAQ